MSLLTLDRPVRVPTWSGHAHTRSCWWDHLAGRWSGPDHPAPAPRIPDPRPSEG